MSGELPDPVLCANSFLAAQIASLTAQWTDDARTRAGSPEAGEAIVILLQLMALSSW